MSRGGLVSSVAVTSGEQAGSQTDSLLQAAPSRQQSPGGLRGVDSVLLFAAICGSDAVPCACRRRSRVKCVVA